VWRRGETTVETILEYVQGMAKTLMSIDATLKDIEELLEEAEGGDP
jgi:hypothetical protein